MKKQIGLLLSLLLFLTGCNPQSAETIFAPPQMPEQFSQLNTLLGQIRDAGLEYVSPASGSNRQPVQMFDLDGDGTDECIAFFRDVKNGGAASVCFFEYADGAYRQCGAYEGGFAAIDSVTYADLLGNGVYELIVGWEAENAAGKRVTVYQVAESGLSSIAEIPYQQYIVGDFGTDGMDALCVVSAEDASPRAQLSLYGGAGGALRRVAVTTLTTDAPAIRRIVKGKLGGDLRGLFVTGAYQGGYMTDILILQGSEFLSVGVDPSGRPAFCTYDAPPQDIDGDGVVEFAINAVDAPQADAPTWELIWRTYDPEAGIRDKAYTQYCDAGNWYLILPSDWRGAVKTGGAVGGSEITASSDAGPLFAISALSGANRAAVAAERGLVALEDRGGTLYAARLIEKGFRSTAITEEWLRDAFHFRENTWVTGETVTQE